MDPTTVGGSSVPPSELIGSAVQRREDPQLIMGKAEYTDDIQYQGEVHLGLLGSRYGHARIENVDTNEVATVDGVLDVYTWEDIQESDAPGYMRVDTPAEGSAESDTDTGAIAPEHPLLANTKVTYQGQPVAAVVAEDRYTVRDALERIIVDYERLDAVIDPRDALSEDVPQIHETNAENLAFEWETGDEDAADATLAAADNVVTVDFEINRVIPTAMEPRTAVARYRSSDDELAVAKLTTSVDRRFSFRHSNTSRELRSPIHSLKSKLERARDSTSAGISTRTNLSEKIGLESLILP